MLVFRRLAIIGTLALVGCATAPEAVLPAGDAKAADTIMADEIIAREYDIAVDTVDKLIAAKNPQAAIDRLNQLMQNGNLSPATRLSLLEKRAELRLDNYDVYGAIADYETILDQVNDLEDAARITDLLNIARGKATSLNFAANAADTSRTRRAELKFELGEHGDAIDLIRDFNLTPNNDILVAMFQIGYLCNDAALTGQDFTIDMPSGENVSARFCDSGK